MNIIIKQRTTIKASYTKHYRSLKTMFESRIVFENIEAKFSLLERTFCNLKVLGNIRVIT